MNQFFKETNGQSSMTRLIFFVGMLYAMGFLSFWTFKQQPTPGAGEIVALWAGLTGTLIGLKLGQKPMEQK